MSREQLAAEAIRKLKAAPTVDVVTAGQAWGIGRHGAYAACRSGQIVTVKVGRKWRCLSKPILRELGYDE